MKEEEEGKKKKPTRTNNSKETAARRGIVIRPLIMKSIPHMTFLIVLTLEKKETECGAEEQGNRGARGRGGGPGIFD